MFTMERAQAIRQPNAHAGCMFGRDDCQGDGDDEHDATMLMAVVAMTVL